MLTLPYGVEQGEGMKMNKSAWKATNSVELSTEPFFLSFFFIVYDKREVCKLHRNVTTLGIALRGL